MRATGGASRARDARSRRRGIARRDLDARRSRRRATARDDGPWRSLGAGGGARRLFCVAHAGAGPLAFAPWRTHLPAEIETHAAALPGHPGGPAGAPLATVEAVVAHLLAGLRPLLDRPFVLFGASFGGRVAFELARALHREGLRGPARLIVAATAAPDRPHPLPDGLDAALGGDVAALVGLGFVPSTPGIEAALPALLPALAADLRALRAHAAVSSPIAAPITALGFRGDALVDRAALAGWAALTEADFTLRLLDGGHLAWRDHLQAAVDAIG
ncbi:MAG: thioesterase [Myxococcales bacterium]|nr:thioesterase [Myxococcales bacterium]